MPMSKTSIREYGVIDVTFYVTLKRKWLPIRVDRGSIRLINIRTTSNGGYLFEDNYFGNVSPSHVRNVRADPKRTEAMEDVDG